MNAREKKQTGGRTELERTRPRRAMAAALALALPLAAAGQSADTGFDVTKHGFSFGNSWNDVCLVLLGGTKLRYDTGSPACFAKKDPWGLCGGMSLLAGERFRSGQTSIELTQPQAKGAVTDRQMRTLDAGTVTKFMNWIASPDQGHMLDANHSVGHKMKEDWEKAIKPRLDRREPVVVGLIYDKRADLVQGRELAAIADLSKQHQVLAIGYTQNGSSVALRAYDPNAPKDELVLGLSLGSTGVSQRYKTGRAVTARSVRGVMFVRGVDANGALQRFCPAGKFSTMGDDHACVCAKGNKKYGGIGNSVAWCEGAEACPQGKFSTTGDHRGCFCAEGNKTYGGIGNSEAWCSGGTTCPGGKFSTTGKWRGCKCPPGQHKKYSGLFDSEAKCKS